jgi:hypothetical protein
MPLLGFVLNTEGDEIDELLGKFELGRAELLGQPRYFEFLFRDKSYYRSTDPIQSN